MLLSKLISLIGQGAKAGRKMYSYPSSWKKMNHSNEISSHHVAGKHLLSYVTLHERNGSRGNGYGLARRKQHNKFK